MKNFIIASFFEEKYEEKYIKPRFFTSKEANVPQAVPSLSEGKNEGKYLKSQKKRLVREDLVKTALTLFLGEYFQSQPTKTHDTLGKDSYRYGRNTPH